MFHILIGKSKKVLMQFRTGRKNRPFVFKYASTEESADRDV